MSGSDLDLWSLLAPATVERLNRQWFELQTDIRLHVVERPGKGSPVICLHGIWDWWGYFLPLALADPPPFAGRPLLLVDLRGHGDSSKPERGYSLRDYAADVVNFIDQYTESKVGLLGHSLGALTSLLTAAQIPERLDLLVLEDPPLPLPKGGSDMFRGVFELRAQSLEAVAEEFQMWRPWVTQAQALESAMCLKVTADGVFTATFGPEFANEDVPAPGREIDAPTLVIQAGSEDQRALRPGGASLLRGVLPTMSIETIEGTSHTVLRDAPDQYVALLHRFLSDAD